MRVPDTTAGRVPREVTLAGLPQIRDRGVHGLHIVLHRSLLRGGGFTMGDFTRPPPSGRGTASTYARSASCF